MKHILAATGGGTYTIPPNGVDFDGTYDYLSRSSDLVGNVDSKTFTFSAWVYFSDVSGSSNRIIFQSNNGTEYFYIGLLPSIPYFYFGARNAAGTEIMSGYFAPTPTELTNKFLHILVSVDLTNTANRKVYINDVFKSTGWAAYTNDFIDFTRGAHYIGAGDTGQVSKVKGRLSHLFLDYTYRDLSIEANRRLFITADGKPTPTATLKALNPILYLPMKDAATAHINEGTGGNFTLNGTIATSERGANQDNCKASYFDGTADYLSKTSLTGVADGKQFTLSFNINPKNGYNDVFNSYSSGAIRLQCSVDPTTGNMLVVGRNSANTVILNFTVGGFGLSKNYNVSISIDLSSALNRRVIVNGNVVSATWTTYVNDILDLVYTTPLYIISGVGTPSGSLMGNLGELYFDTKYIDLATNNPFWDKYTNKPKPVRQVIKETGVTPLIAMPLDASNAGKNYGTGGDFTVNSGPYVGARGASEFWARSAKFDGSTGYLSRTNGLSGLADSKSFSVVFNVNLLSSSSNIDIIGISDSIAPNTGRRLQIRRTSTNEIQFLGYNSSGTILLNITTATSGSFTSGSGDKIILASFQLGTTNRSVYINGVLNSFTLGAWTDDFIELGVCTHIGIGASYDGALAVSGFYNGIASMCYFTTDYIDFSQEVNRLKFVDAMGYPTDIGQKITDGIIPKPLIYLPFDDTTNLGKNLGTGGDFVVNGSVLPSSDVLG